MIELSEKDYGLLIKRAENGFIIQYINSDGEEEPFKCEAVFEEKEDEEFSEHEALIEVLWYVVEHFGLCGSKHDKKRIRIGLKKQNQ